MIRALADILSLLTLTEAAIMAVLVPYLSVRLGGLGRGDES